MTHLDGASDENLVVDATPLAARPAANVGFVHLDMLARPAADPVLAGPHHARAELVQDAKGRFVARKAKLPLKLYRMRNGSPILWQWGQTKPSLQRARSK